MLGPHLTHSPGLAYLHAKYHLDPSSHLVTINTRRKFGGSIPFWGGGAGSTSNTVAWAEAYLHTKWHFDSCSHLAATDMGRKLGGCAPLGEGEPDPHLTQCGQAETYLHTKFHLDPSNCLLNTDKQDRQTGQWSDSIGGTVFGRPFIKWFALCYQTTVCAVCL